VAGGRSIRRQNDAAHAAGTARATMSPCGFLPHGGIRCRHSLFLDHADRTFGSCLHAREIKMRRVSGGGIHY
jgi:hypothetical protein